MTEHKSADDFDAAKKIFDELKALDKERQERVLRWVAETLGHDVAHSGAGQSGGSVPPAPLHPPLTVAQPGGAKDIRTFVTEKNPSSDNQFAAVVAYYYRFEAPAQQRKNTISGSDLQEAARLAGRKRLSNPRQTLKNAKALGYLDNPGRGEFAVNTVGENLVAMTLPGGGEAAVSTRRTRKGSSTKRKSTRKARK